MKVLRAICISLLGLAMLTLVGGAQGGPPDPAELVRIAESLVAQLGLAHQEAVFGMLAPTLNVAKIHAQRVINLIQGKSGPDYNPAVGEIGDGIGALAHAEHFREGIRNTPLASVFLLGIENVIFDLSAPGIGAIHHAKRALQAPDLNRVRLSLRAARAFLYSARGSPLDPVSEGGARAILARLRAGR
ncbi:MAG: hypothetical protein N3E42_00820 [Candidatus Bipolaricaulota bacterium]|nr:hypothetical protein [Candidatus Bipolaricaulota bacterium]